MNLRSKVFLKLSLLAAVFALNFGEIAIWADNSFTVYGNVCRMDLRLVQSEKSTENKWLFVRVVVDTGTLDVANPFFSDSARHVGSLLFFENEIITHIEKLGHHYSEDEQRKGKLLLSSGSGAGGIFPITDKLANKNTRVRLVLFSSFYGEPTPEKHDKTSTTLTDYRDIFNDQIIAISDELHISPKNNPLVKNLESQGFSYNLELNKKEWHVGESVMADCILINYSETPILISYDLTTPLDRSKSAKLLIFSEDGVLQGDLFDSLRKSVRRPKRAFRIPANSCYSVREGFRAGATPGIGFILGRPHLGKCSLQLTGIKAFEDDENNSKDEHFIPLPATFKSARDISESKETPFHVDY